MAVARFVSELHNTLELKESTATCEGVVCWGGGREHMKKGYYVFGRAVAATAIRNIHCNEWL